MSEEDFYTVSHDAKDAPHFTHRAYVIKSGIAELGDIVAIMDEDRSHLAFMRGWVNCVIDIDNNWSLNNGVFGMDLKLWRNNKNKNLVKYKVKFTVKQVKKILCTPLCGMAICDERKEVLVPFMPRVVNHLYKFYKMKHVGDRYMIDNLKSIPGWHVG